MNGSEFSRASVRFEFDAAKLVSAISIRLFKGITAIFELIPSGMVIYYRFALCLIRFLMVVNHVHLKFINVSVVFVIF